MLKQEADRYFSFLGRNFPVMCASDEFHYLPRAGIADDFLDRLDNLDRDAVKDSVRELKLFQARFRKLIEDEEIDFEKKTDLELLVANINGFLVEFEVKESYLNNPLLYLKVAFIGLDHALDKPSESREEVFYRAGKRLEAIPLLLKQGRNNLARIPESFREPALAMAADCQAYLQEKEPVIGKRVKERVLPGGILEKAFESLEEFTNFLYSLKSLPDSRFSSDTLNLSLQGHFQSARSLEELCQVAEEEWHLNFRRLEETGKQINPALHWRELYENITPPDMGDAGMIGRYRKEAENVIEFFRDSGLLDVVHCSGMAIEETPLYLRSVRGSASFAAALNPGSGEIDRFYITTGGSGKKAGNLKSRRARRLNREYKFLTAHETIPGHYLLDCCRRNLENPVRRQIESPLFYEGWASYAETLLTEHQYVISAEDRLIDFRRRLWRAARCQIDSGLATGRMNREKGINLLEKVGFSRNEAASQIDRFRLNPGYQLCYCLGSYEIRMLAEKYGGKLGLRKFYQVLLNSGEIPFKSLEKVFERISAGNDDGV